MKGDPIQAWRSFSTPYREDIVHLKMPIYIAYGTADPSSESCDLLPIYFELYGKKNYELTPYVDRGHSFQKVVNGKSDYNDIIFKDIIQIFILWTENLQITERVN
ncbi:hypothetical protein CLV62_101268 [Dysgonomonas alginatilytica]|uniref:Prolyl oligopeptidase family protein n=1 Tax=Dysgonomonas alginatilytica TaxID=1605892 RepID=A0A2V3PVZ1_9BACT|nr:hypothetical protein [Dysgonomonas alginatilytica]PXV69001.1 hypothetical protein CLV62_101268 [Dysgonomonas alginatilytica]